MLGLDALLDRLPQAALRRPAPARRDGARHRPPARRIFLFDEPLSNLDAALRAEVRVEIRRLHDRLGATTLYVTHDQVEAMTLADTLWVLNGGHVEQRGAPLEVYERPRDALRRDVPRLAADEPRRGRARARAAARWRAKAGGVLASVDDERFGARSPRARAVSVGVRPHDLALARRARAGAALLDVEIVEALGSEAFAHGWLRASGPRVVARLEAADAQRVKTGDALPLAVDPRRVHLFDPTTGRALALGADERLRSSPSPLGARRRARLRARRLALRGASARPLRLWHAYRGDEEKALDRARCAVRGGARRARRRCSRCRTTRTRRSSRRRSRSAHGPGPLHRRARAPRRLPRARASSRPPATRFPSEDVAALRRDRGRGGHARTARAGRCRSRASASRST